MTATALISPCDFDKFTEVKDLYLPQPATVVSQTVLTPNEMLFEMRFDSGQELGHMPGQFVEVTVPGVGEAPISISSSPDRKGTFELVVRRAGRVTEAMHASSEGAKFGIRGPFGTHFPVDEAMKGRDVVFIAGGIGLAPLRSAIHYVLNHRQDYGKVTILYGTKSPAERLFLGELADWSKRADLKFMETVDRGDAGWKGNVGVITTLIPRAEIDPAKAVIVACGPPVMYKFVVVSLYAVNVENEKIFVSLERRMKCGIGKCGHCQINGLYACMDGPVFNYADIVGSQEAI
jgi:NAD(P)H-flavin reductase